MAALDDLLRQITDPSTLAWNEETYDLARARGLSAADRATYVAKLSETARQGDTRAILTLGHLGEALPLLQAAAKSTDPWAGTARRALVLLGHGAEVLDEIVDTALHSPAKMARVAAVMDLPKIGGAKAIAALEQALGDADSSVRTLAWDGIVEIFDLGRAIRSPEGKLDKSSQLEFLQDYLACDLASLVAIGVDELRAISRKLAAGASATTLGIGWSNNPAPDVWKQIVAAIIDPSAGFPVDDIAKLTGTWRRWAEACLAMRLDQATPDARAPEALAQLHATWTIPVLEEVERAPRTSATLRDTLMHAIRTLRAS